MIPWSSFATDHDDSLNKFSLSLVGWSSEDLEISMNNVQDIHKLPFILMNSLDLDIVKGIDGDIIPSRIFNPLSQYLFVSSVESTYLYYLLALIRVITVDSSSQLLSSHSSLVYNDLKDALFFLSISYTVHTQVCFSFIPVESFILLSFLDCFLIPYRLIQFLPLMNLS